MRIGIDARILGRNKAGLERYLSHLLQNLARIDRKNEYVLYSDHDLDEYGLELESNFSIKEIKKIVHSQIWRNFSLARQSQEDNLDIFHFPDASVWMNKAKRTIVTIHDISPVLFPELQMAPRKMLYYFKFLFWLIKKKADIIIAVSERTKQDLVEYLQLDEKRIRVIYSGIEPYFRVLESDETDNVCKKFGIRKDFIFFVGTFQKRKNLPGLIKAYNKFIERSGLDYDFVIAGESMKTIGCSFYTQEELMNMTHLRNRIHFIGRINDKEAVALI